jgi:hypothetical protein
MEPIPFPRLLIGYALMFGLPLAMLWFPRTWWAQILSSRVGPDLEVAHQTRADCLRNAVVFALLGAAAIGAWLGTSFFAEAWFGSIDRVMPLAVLAFTYAILGLVGFGGAIYLLARAPFRPAVLAVPAPQPAYRVLKEYESRDRTFVVFLVVDDADCFFVLVPVLTPSPEGPQSIILGPCGTLEDAEREALRASGHLDTTGV